MRHLTSALVIAFCAPAAHAQTIKAVDAVISQFEDGQSLSGAQKMVPGEIVFVRFTAADYKVNDGKIRLLGHAQILDSRGTPIAATDEQAIETTLREEDKQFRPRFHFQFQLPSIAPPGTWRVRFDLTDKQTNQQAQGETSFPVDGQDVPATPALAVQRFAFYRGQDDEAALKIAAYRPGDSVWVRFDVTGYKYGEQNAIDVAYDVAVLAPDGRQLFRQENAAVERSQAFYPQPWVPGTFSITLQPNMRPGNYTLAITARDGVGKTDASAKAGFKVE